MTSAARTLAEFAVGLKYESLPPEAVACARSAVIDTIAAMTFGATLPWSRIVINYVRNTSAPGEGSVVGTDVKARGPLAALANGALAHAFELDGGIDPGAGVHPGATVVAPGVPVAQEHGRSGKELLTAIVAAVEVMYRIGDAARHSSEKLGFHGPVEGHDLCDHVGAMQPVHGEVQAEEEALAWRALQQLRAARIDPVVELGGPLSSRAGSSSRSNCWSKSGGSRKRSSLLM